MRTIIYIKLLDRMNFFEIYQSVHIFLYNLLFEYISLQTWSIFKKKVLKMLLCIDKYS